MADIIYILCALTGVACCVLLWKAWRSTRSRLLFWSALCFAGLSVSNILLVTDKVLLPGPALGPLRLGITLLALLLLLFGLIWSDE